MRKFIFALVVALVVLTSAADCEKSGSASGSNNTKPPETTGVTGTLIVRSKIGLDGYTRWTTGWFGKPAGKLVEARRGTYRVAGFCVPRGYEAKGKMTNSFDWTSDITIKGGDCKKVNHLERYDLTVKKS